MPVAPSQPRPIVVVTGALGFIGSCVTTALHRMGNFQVVISDDFSATQKMRNLTHLADCERVDRSEIATWIAAHNQDTIAWVLHIGARTDTTEFDEEIFNRLNIQSTQSVWEVCTRLHIPLIYASSAATYGSGEQGYRDDHAIVPLLKPLNPYGWSKQRMDAWILQQQETPPHWYGLKFFNVYGPNEYHKGRMASVILHAFKQMQQTGRVKLFKSHHPDFRDGYQLRDFIYVQDVVQVILWLMEHKPQSGLYNLGTGKAESFYQLASSTAQALGIPLEIDWVDIPEDIRDKYQYFTEADMSKLRAAGYAQPFQSLSAGAFDYVTHYLIPDKVY